MSVEQMEPLAATESADIDSPLHCQAGGTVAPGPTPDTVRASDGSVLTPPEGWALLHPVDPVLTQRVKAAGDHWVVWETKGRKVVSRGLWAAAPTIARIRAELETERSTKRPAKRKSSDVHPGDNTEVERGDDSFRPQHSSEFIPSMENPLTAWPGTVRTAPRLIEAIRIKRNREPFHHLSN